VTYTTWYGTLHNAFSTVVFRPLAATCLVLATPSAKRPRQWPWAVYSAATGVALPALQPLLNALTSGTADSGLIQKINIAVCRSWVALLAAQLIIRFTGNSWVLCHRQGTPHLLPGHTRITVRDHSVGHPRADGTGCVYGREAG
jgi:hypothetical protein